MYGIYPLYVYIYDIYIYTRVYIYIYIYIWYLYFIPWVWNKYSIPESTSHLVSRCFWWFRPILFFLSWSTHDSNKSRSWVSWANLVRLFGSCSSHRCRRHPPVAFRPPSVAFRPPSPAAAATAGVVAARRSCSLSTKLPIPRAMPVVVRASTNPASV
jgi:hypothetical protein